MFLVQVSCEPGRHSLRTRHWRHLHTCHSCWLMAVSTHARTHEIQVYPSYSWEDMHLEWQTGYLKGLDHWIETTASKDTTGGPHWETQPGRISCVRPVNERRLTWQWRVDCLFNNLFRLTAKKHQSSGLLTLCEGNHCWPVDSHHRRHVMRKVCSDHDVIVLLERWVIGYEDHRAWCLCDDL